ncbi:helix-turn-helix domain-containing protein [Vulcanisaeta distributa]|uniref:Transcriptional regulator, IclR family n=1 Tax=Vulcanisaeta distributa (strain DSM 14429 / JCM 11212 / NBRC 100878 / IC-017) TaxID=572478 RepID=E1QQI8_VULDI|nr:helix-turn-helix domain-containing protein [Vulcanisaeta distributa]ADN50483.1 transcriptional regulator, IclR family [Vulcanisaeta distributa DSM 14429]
MSIKVRVGIKVPKFPSVISGGIRILSEYNFDFGVQLDRAKLLKLIAFGVVSPTELIRRLNMPKAKVFRYLNALIKHGWLVRKDGGYYLAATIFLVYRVREFGDYAVLEVLNDKGAIVDQKAGLVIINGKESPRACPRCPLLQECTNNIRSISKSLGITIKSVTPADAYLELISTIINEGLVKILLNDYIDLHVNNSGSI